MDIFQYRDVITEINPLLDSKFKYDSKRWKGLNDKYTHALSFFLDKDISRQDLINAYREYYCSRVEWYLPFLLTMIWGFSTNGYGTFRTNNYISNEKNILNIKTALDAVKQQDLKLAYDSLNNIKGLNISYISKVLYFATRACSYKEYAVIFDIRVARSLVKLSVPKDVFEIIEIFPSTKFKHYVIFNTMMHKYAQELGVEAESLEMFLFESKDF
ncbi:8-oxoguanine DNA glycosylase OGG fold protein [Sphingobacterium hungaricum]